MAALAYTKQEFDLSTLQVEAGESRFQGHLDYIVSPASAWGKKTLSGEEKRKDWILKMYVGKLTIQGQLPRWWGIKPWDSHYLGQHGIWNTGMQWKPCSWDVMVVRGRHFDVRISSQVFTSGLWQSRSFLHFACTGMPRLTGLTEVISSVFLILDFLLPDFYVTLLLVSILQSLLS